MMGDLVTPNEESKTRPIEPNKKETIIWISGIKRSSSYANILFTGQLTV